MAKKNLYRILGVNQKADSAKIKKAYRRAAKKYHPDISPKGEEKFKEVQEAYETLSDPEKKAVYDHERSSTSVSRPHSYHDSQPLRSHPFRTRPSSFSDEIDQLFSTVEDFWMGTWPEFLAEREEDRTESLSLEIILTPSEARDGCEIPLKVPILKDCRRCLGTGSKEGFICGLCRGRGKERRYRKIHLTIPAGVKNGMQIRISLSDQEFGRVDLIANLSVSQ